MIFLFFVALCLSHTLEPFIHRHSSYQNNCDRALRGHINNHKIEFG